MCQYLERFGGYAGQRETGYTMWCLAHVMDCLTEQDYAGAQEFLALTFVALDQSSLDHGKWDFAWLLTLLEEPPAQLFHGRGTSANPRARAFSPLSPVGWTTCALQYLKGVDLITTRRLGSQKAAPTSPPVLGSQKPTLTSWSVPRPSRAWFRYPCQFCCPSHKDTFCIISRVNFAPAQACYFPLPLPVAGIFVRFSLECSSRTRRRIMHQRLLHIVCMALNFLHSNFVPIPLSVLQRPPNAAQRSLVAHVGRHLKAFGASVGEFVLSDSDRRNPQLIARLSELTTFLAASSTATGDT